MMRLEYILDDAKRLHAIDDHVERMVYELLQPGTEVEKQTGALIQLMLLEHMKLQPIVDSRASLALAIATAVRASTI